MRYISNTPVQQREMLGTIGVGSIEDLLSRIPTKARLSRPLNVPAAMGAYVGVAQGSLEPPKFIHLTYRPKQRARKRVVVIGKGITFDSGGLDLKPADGMAASAALLVCLAFFVGPRVSYPVVPFLFLTGLLAGSAHGFLYPALAALLMDVTPEVRRGGAVGIFSAVFLVGNALGSIVFGHVAHWLGYRVMLPTLSRIAVE